MSGTTTTTNTPTTTNRAGVRWTRRLAVTVAGIAAAVPLAAAPSGTTAAYNTGVKSLHFAGVADSCDPGQALPCTPGAGVGDANVLRVTQEMVDGHLRYSGLEGTSVHDEHLWIAAEIGVECRRFHDIIRVGVDADIDGPSDWVAAGNNAGIGTNADPFPAAISHPDARVMPTKRVAVDVPIDLALDEGLIDFFPTAEDVFAAGEAEIERRIDDGMTYAEARALPYELNTAILLAGTAECDLPGLAAARGKRVVDAIPLRIEFVPATADAPVGDVDQPADVTAPAQVTDVSLVIVPDADPCTLHLSGTISTNAPVEVEYRWVDLFGHHSATQSIVVGKTQVAFVTQELTVPMQDEFEADGLVAEGAGDVGGLVTESGDELFSGVMELEILSPNPMSALDGFSVPFCTFGSAGGGGVEGGAQTLAPRTAVLADR
jgi:hypothetical protein